MRSHATQHASWAVAALAVLLAVGVAPTDPVGAQQHETAADVEDGGRAFRGTCANCHGQDGDQVPGVDLGRGQFRRASSDEELMRIIQRGIPGTAMPGSPFSNEQAARVVAYLRSVAASKRGGATTGDAARGRGLFNGTGGCTNCHRVNQTGSRVGPDLTAIGQLRRSVELEQALLDPAADVQPANRSYRVVTRDGRATTGRLLNQDTYSVQIIDGQERLLSFLKADLREHGFTETPMPSYRGRLTPQEVADLVSYLASLKGSTAP